MKQGDLVEAIRVLETDLPDDVEASLRRCEAEEEGNAKAVLSAILENVRYAREKGIPMCQDTGTLVFFVSGAPDASRVYEVIEGALIRATEEVPLRPNTVSPLSRENDGRNLGRGNPIVHFERAGK
ncbi:MAG TPA: fumarate hydratase, partial [Candidatus Methanomethylicus sp.]|nr:fumarate hydratase [Candidatus Methanomethylicus sp.]